MNVSDAIKLLRQYPGDANAEAILANPPKLPDAPVPVAPSKTPQRKKTTEPESTDGNEG